MIVNGYRIHKLDKWVIVTPSIGMGDVRYRTARGSGAIARATAFARSQRPGPNNR